MIDLRALDSRLAAQDRDLRRVFDDLVGAATGDGANEALLRIVAEGLAAIHERQRTAILVMAQTP
jgi:hypothetical protein